MSSKSNRVLSDFLKDNQKFSELAQTNESVGIPTVGFAKYKSFQEPKVAVLACADSRVSPELITSRGFGDLFVVRSAGNIADSHAIGSLEFAVSNLGAELIVVLGHTGCGAVKAAAAISQDEMKSQKPKSHLEQLVFRIAEGFPDDEQDLLRLTQINTERSAISLINESPIIRDAIKTKQVQIASGVYSIQTGKIDMVPSSALTGGDHE